MQFFQFNRKYFRNVIQLEDSYHRTAEQFVQGKEEEEADNIRWKTQTQKANNKSRMKNIAEKKWFKTILPWLMNIYKFIQRANINYYLSWLLFSPLLMFTKEILKSLKICGEEINDSVQK